MHPPGSRNTWTPRKNKMPMTDEETLDSDYSITACPQPQRAVLLPGSPGEHARSLPSSPHSTVEDQELRELMGVGRDLSKDSFTKDTFHSSGRTLSSISTSAGATPILDNWPCTVPSTPQVPRLDEVENEFEEDEKADKENSSTAFGGSSKAGTRHKVFVGGIPQDLDQEEVKQLMSQYAPVKKAWLQKHKDSPPGAPSNTQRHRGFGFVIFNDAASVDLLLGDKTSRYLNLPDGRRIEVKRAVSSADMLKSAESDAGTGLRQPQQPGLKQPLQSSWNASQRSQQGQLGPSNSQSRLSDPRQSPPHGGFRTPDHSSSTPTLLGTPPRVAAMQQGRLTPVPPPPSPWNQSPSPSPSMMAGVPMMGGSVMVMPRAPGPTNQASPGVLPVGPTMTPMQCNNISMRPQQPQVTPTQSFNPAVCNIPWTMELVQGTSNALYTVAPANMQPSAQTGSQSVPCPGGPPAGWAAQWEVAMAAAHQRQQMMQVQPHQRIQQPQGQLTLPTSPMHQQSPQQKSRELDLIREDQPLQIDNLPHQQQESHTCSQHGQVQAPVRSQTPISPGSPHHWWQIEEAQLREAMPECYED